MPTTSACRQNYPPECEAGINKQINLELYANYVYTSMAFYFDRDDVALPGFHKFFKKAADEEKDHAQKLMEFQNKRGGRIVLKDIKKPERDEWGSGLEAMRAALDLEKTVNQSIIDLHKLAGECGDQHMTHYLDDFLDEQVQGIKEIADHVTRLQRVGPGLGEHLYDKDLA
jgi:ferritin heavy chain